MVSSVCRTIDWRHPIYRATYSIHSMDCRVVRRKFIGDSLIPHYTSLRQTDERLWWNCIGMTAISELNRYTVKLWVRQLDGGVLPDFVFELSILRQ